MRQTVALVSRRELRHAALFRRLAALPRHEDRAFLAHSFEDIYLHLGESLRSTDRMSMAYSIENRVPFLDNTLIDFALNLPLSAKYHRGRTKRLVHGLGTRRLPQDVIDLPKIGFWVRDSMWRGMDPLLRGGVIAELLGWRRSDEQALLELVGRHRRFLFRMVCFELWGRLFFRGETTEGLTEDLLRHRRDA
jgi:asparagine synthase (glutamine-hydrolysing)